jgi:hypothetical protein
MDKVSVQKVVHQRIKNRNDTMKPENDVLYRYVRKLCYIMLY